MKNNDKLTLADNSVVYFIKWTDEDMIMTWDRNRKRIMWVSYKFITHINDKKCDLDS
jgi:hypothetical protein